MGVEQLTETVHEFLDLTRIEAGELRLDLEPVDMSAVLADALRRIDGQAKAQGIELRARMSDLPRVSADPLRLRAVFDNILSNALKYTPSGGRITVDSHRVASHEAGARDTLTIRIADTGPGIPAAISAAHLRQVLSTRRPPGRGSRRSARRRHRPVYVSADCRVARRRNRVRRRAR